VQPAIGKYSLLWGETPIQPLPRFAEKIGVKSCWIKRDDLTGFAFGGNKLRKLEYLLADALSQKCDLIITGGSPQSNHARLTAAAARRAGLDVWLCFAGNSLGRVQGNLLLDQLLDARLILTGVYGSEDLLTAMHEQAEAARREGYRPYVIPVGGSSPVGDYGYVKAWASCWQQVREKGLPSFDRIVLPVGSGGTIAGLWVGNQLNPAPARLTGISVWMEKDELEQEVYRLIRDLLPYVGLETADWTGGLPELHDDYIGRKYGVPSPDGNEAIRLLAQTEGIFTDPIYTGKALAGLIDIAAKQDCSEEHVLFWHTGGTPALFTHAASIT
jgi:D-cysteine desulfhydrase family pyridoxal phosphate-dependent enzyme